MTEYIVSATAILTFFVYAIVNRKKLGEYFDETQPFGESRGQRWISRFLWILLGYCIGRIVSSFINSSTSNEDLDP